MLVRVFRVTDKLSNATLKSSVWVGSGFLRQSHRFRQTLEIATTNVLYSLYLVLNMVLRRFFGLMRYMLQGNRKVYEAAKGRQRTIMAQRAALAAAAALERIEKTERKLVLAEQRYAIQPRGEATLIEDPLRAQNRTLSMFAMVLIVALIALVIWSTDQENGANLGQSAGIVLIQNTTEPLSQPATRVSTPTPIPNPLNWRGTLVFSIRDSGQSDIYALQRGDAQPRRLTNSLADERDPVWSPDGRTIAFSSNRDGPWELYVMDVITKQITRLTYSPNFEGSPTWSPDGVFLAYEYYDNANGNMDIYIVAADGSQVPQRLTDNPTPDLEPAWRPTTSGREIAYSTWLNGQQDIVVISLDNPNDDVVLNITNTIGINENYPKWSADGQFVSYTVTDNGLEYVSYRAVANPTIEESIGRGRTAAWNPIDGSSLFYVSERPQQNISIIINGEKDSFGIAGDLATIRGIVYDLDWSPYEPIFEPIGANVSPLFVESSALTSDGLAGLAPLVGVNAPDAFLNAQVDASFNALRARVIEKTGVDYLGTLDDAWWRAERSPEIGQPRESWHYAGRAIALQRNLIEQGNPPNMVVVREDDEVGRTYWRVFLRVRDTAQNGTLGEPLRYLPWDFAARADSQYYEDGGKLMDVIPPGYYIDFTQLAADYGWLPIAADRTWRVNTTGMLYWQFIKTDNLDWQAAMRQLYTEQELSVFLGGGSLPDSAAPNLEPTPTPTVSVQRTPTPQPPP